MSDIVLSAGVRQNLLALQNTAQLMSVTQNRLATGKKVNTALDNPVNFFTSAGLQSRAGDLSSLLDAMSSGLKTIEAANNGITAITTTIQSMKSTLLQARQDKSFNSTAYSIDSATIAAGGVVKNLQFSGGSITGTVNVALNSITSAGVQATLSTTGAYLAPSTATQAAATGGAYTVLAAGQTYAFKVNGQDINLDNTTGDTLAHAVTNIQSQLDTRFGAGTFTVTSSGGGIRIAGKSDGTNDVVISNIAAGGGATAANLGFGTGTTAFGTPADSYDFTVNGDNVSIAAGTGLAAAIISVNTQLSAVNSKFQAFDNGGQLGIQEITPQGATLTIGGTDATSLFGATLTNTGTAAGTAAVKTVDQLAAAINANASLTGRVSASNDNGRLRIYDLSTGNLTVTGIGSGSGQVDGSAGTSAIGGNTVRQNLVKQYNDLRDQLDKLADDASFNGINLLRGDQLKITFNETGTSTILIQAKDQNGNVRPINSTNLNISLLQNSDFDLDSNIDTLLDGLGQSLNMIRAQASTFGSNLSVVQNRQDFTKSMINTLQTGADNLVLADTNEEGANMLALQTRQQLSTTALSLANQASQAVLRLFG